MATAKIESLDAIKQFRTALIKFTEKVNASLGNADSDVNQAVSWLEMEAKPFWQSEIRKRQMLLGQALEALRMKVLYKNYDGTTPSCVDEKKMVEKCKRRLEEANQKLAAVQKYSTLMQRESVLYKGSVQRFSSTIQSGSPVAIAQLGRVMDAIDAYLAATPEASGLANGAAREAGAPTYLDFLTNMTRSPDEAAAADPVEAAQTGGGALATETGPIDPASAADMVGHSGETTPTDVASPGHAAQTDEAKESP